MELRVHELIDLNRRCWDEEKLGNTFGVEDCQKVKQIPLSLSLPCDSRYWWPTQDGIFTVKSAYWLARLGVVEAWRMFSGQQNTEVWKLCHFVWRAFKGTLGAMAVLYRRHIRPNSVCNGCGDPSETIMHSLFECTHAATIWAHSEFSQLIVDAPNSSFMERFKV